jgi:hypothetical protein
MPKLGKSYNGLISFNCSDELRQKLLALSYLRRGNRYYAPEAREILTRAVEREIEGLSVGDRRDYERILENVTITAAVRRQSEAETHARPPSPENP